MFLNNDNANLKKDKFVLSLTQSIPVTDVLLCKRRLTGKRAGKGVLQIG